MIEAFEDAFWDSFAALPWLLIIYILFELLESRYEGLLKRLMARSRPFGPLLGALVGCIPQCGFSMVASALYCHRTMSLGTLMAVFLSTSDEAVPIILAQPDQIAILAPLLFTKVMIAMLAGFSLDALLPRLKAATTAHASSCHCVEDTHLCAHKHTESRSFWSRFFIAPGLHTLQVFSFILLVSWVLNILILGIGEQQIRQLFLLNSPLQPLLAVLVGLIPNCAASVVVTQIFLKGGISFGSAVAGLCASSGLGLIVLVKESPSTTEAVKIIGLLAVISFLAGIVLNLFL